MAVVRSYMTLSYHQINCDSYTKVSDVDLTTNETNCGSCTKVPDVNLTTHTQSCVDKDYQRSFLGADICGRCHTKVGLCLKVRSHHSLVTPKSRAVPFGWTDREKVALFICVPALICVKLRAQELCESRGGRPGLPGPNSPYGVCTTTTTTTTATTTTTTTTSLWPYSNTELELELRQKFDYISAAA